MKADRMESGTDTFATLLWGLRRYVVLVLAMVLALGLLVPLALSHRAEVFEATAQVGPGNKLELSNADPLPRIAESVFNNGAVEEAIRAQLGQPHGNIIPSKVRLVAAQDNLVLEVVARAPTATEAMQIANTAARIFALELNRYKESVAEFFIMHSAVLAKKVPKIAGGYASVALGLVAGLLAGIGLVGLVMVLRRPVVDASTAQDVAGSPVIGRLTLPRHGPPNAADDRAVGLLCRRLLTTSATTVHVAAPKRAQAEHLAGLMRQVFGRIGDVRRQPKRPGEGGQGNVPSVPMVLAPQGADAWIGAPEDMSYTVLLTPEGISSRRLRLFAEAHDTGAPTGVVLFRTHRGRRGKPSARDRDVTP